MDENKVAAKKGGTIARDARRALETKTGRPVVSADNFLPPGKGPRPKAVREG
jgi:DNA-damage-inducible protein D